jgi:hypothetical protein
VYLILSHRSPKFSEIDLSVEKFYTMIRNISFSPPIDSKIACRLIIDDWYDSCFLLLKCSLKENARTILKFEMPFLDCFIEEECFDDWFSSVPIFKLAAFTFSTSFYPNYSSKSSILSAERQ